MLDLITLDWSLHKFKRERIAAAVIFVSIMDYIGYSCGEKLIAFVIAFPNIKKQQQIVIILQILVRLPNCYPCQTMF